MSDKKTPYRDESNPAEQAKREPLPPSDSEDAERRAFERQEYEWAKEE